MGLCDYSNIFGKPNEGFHSYRIFDLAIIDVIATVIAAAVISFVSDVHLVYILLIAFALAIIAHRLFCVRTTIDKLLFP